MTHSAHRHVHVDLRERAYGIEIGSGNLSEIGRKVVEWTKATHAVVITDTNVENPYAQTVGESLNAADCQVELLLVPPGESTKSVQALTVLWEKCLELNVDRKAVIVAVGGGVVGDLAGFVAATFTRGLSFVQVPTTLLAQVDSSVGGKTGINLPGAKNMVGAFWQPRGVLIDIAALDTLPDREYRSGLAEVVKYGVIMDAEFFGYLEQNVDNINARDHSTLAEIVARCCQLKADVVVADEREETGRRSILNYGHTFCHAIEAATGYGTLLHGEAVSIGMVCAARLAHSIGRVGSSMCERQHELLEALRLPTEVPNVDHNQLVSLMKHDKKTEHGRLRFVLPSRLGEVELVGDVDESKVLASLVG